MLTLVSSTKTALKESILSHILMKMGHHIFHEYWLKRCQEMEKKDKDLGINKNLKKRHYGVDCLYRLRQQSTINKYEDLIGIRNNIYYGSDILGYYDSCTP
ncbi:unnamed protein product [Rhizophagus irregularis]|nr:unnamed protein product [Rhizophagus irregularis]